MRGRQGSHPWQESHPWRGTSGGCLGWEQACAWTPIWLGATRTRASTWQAGSSDFMASPRRGGQRAQRAGDTGQIGQAGERTIGHFPGSEHRCEGPVGGPDLERDGAAAGALPGKRVNAGGLGWHSGGRDGAGEGAKSAWERLGRVGGPIRRRRRQDGLRTASGRPGEDARAEAAGGGRLRGASGKGSSDRRPGAAQRGLADGSDACIVRVPAD